MSKVKVVVYHTVYKDYLIEVPDNLVPFTPEEEAFISSRVRGLPDIENELDSIDNPRDWDYQADPIRDKVLKEIT